MPLDDLDLLETIERIYDAAADPAHWQAAIDGITGCYPGGCGSLIIHDVAAHKGDVTVYSGWDAASIDSYNRHFGAQNPRFARLAHWPIGRAVAAETMCDRPALFATEFYNDFLKPLGLPDGLGVALFQDQTRFARLSVLYPESTAADQDRNVALMQRFTPHLQRAFQLNRQLAAADLHCQTAEAGLDRLATGVILLDAGGRVLFVNQAAQRVLDRRDGLSIDGGSQLRAAATGDTERLRRAIAGGGRPTAGSDGVVLLQRPSGRRPYAILLAPLQRQTTPLGSFQRTIAAFVGDPDEKRRPPLRALADAFHLTAAESRLLACLIDGRTPADAAALLDVSINTVKTHLRNLLGKMDCARQADIIRVAALHPAWTVRTDDRD